MHISALERIRVKGYAYGGFVTHTNTAHIQGNLMLMNAIKNMPQPVLGVQEVVDVARRIEVREKISKL